MELKDFIKESLVQISQAIEESNEELKDSSAIVNPSSIEVHGEYSLCESFAEVSIEQKR